MPRDPNIAFHIADEVARFFDMPSYATDGPPRFVVILGGVAVGKSRFRRDRYGHGFVTIDAGEIFLNLSRGAFYPFPSDLEEPMNLIGAWVAAQAFQERRNVVTELILNEQKDSIIRIIEAVRSLGYRIEAETLSCDMTLALEHNATRGQNNISAYYTHKYHERWILDAVSGAHAKSGS
jgi:hypothetical protein